MMKKKILLLVALIVCMALVLSACDLLPDLGLKLPHIHSYSWIDNGDGTHVRHCSKDGCTQPNVKEGPHDWRDGDICVCGAIKPADYVEPEIHVHDYKWVNNGDGTHKQHCLNDGCDEPDIKIGAHDWSASNVCVCGATKPVEGADDGKDENHVHDYQWIDNGDGTHVQHCANDGCPNPDVNSGSHSYTVAGSLQATCLVEGWTKYNCSYCSNTYTDPIATVDHQSAGVVYYSTDRHWELCKYGCDTKLNSSSHSTQLESSLEATCVDHAKDIYKCRGCDYRYERVDNSSVLTGHKYHAYVCMYCQRDLLLDYVDYFAAHGKSSSDPIVVNSQQELTLFVDYAYFNGLLGEEATRYIQLAYLDDNSNTDKLANELASAVNAKTSGSFYLYRLAAVTGKNNVVLFYVADDPDSIASLHPDDGYVKNIYDQMYSIAFDDYTSERSADFDDFKYKQRTYEVSVTTSEQLFYAFEHGYLPKPVSGSEAERILNKAKAVARSIMDDNMSDLEKLKAIYTWLVTDVAYDYGAYNLKGDWSELSAYYLEGVFDYGIAVCDGISKAYCVLAGIENITCIRVSGVIKGEGGHAWNKVWVDADGDGVKKWYASDATWGNTLSGNGELFNLQYFLTTDDDRSERIGSLNSYVDVDCDANTNVNPFECFYYGGGSDSAYDFVIDNQVELNALFAYVATLAKTNLDVCFNVYLSADFCTTAEQFVAAINVARTSTGFGNALSYGFNKTLVEGKVGYVGTIHYDFTNS